RGSSGSRLPIGTSVTVGVCQGRRFSTVVTVGGWSSGSASRSAVIQIMSPPSWPGTAGRDVVEGRRPSLPHLVDIGVSLQYPLGGRFRVEWFHHSTHSALFRVQWFH